MHGYHPTSMAEAGREKNVRMQHMAGRTIPLRIRSLFIIKFSLEQCSNYIYWIVTWPDTWHGPSVHPTDKVELSLRDLKSTGTACPPASISSTSTDQSIL